MQIRHFLDIDQLDAGVLRALLDAARRLKSHGRTVAGKLRVPDATVLAMLFDKPSTRTRVSFDVAMRQIGGQTIVLNRGDMQLGRGETIADTARVLSRFVDIIMIRTGPHANLTELAGNATVPVINGLTDNSHPCQVMADVMTFEEHVGPIAGRSVAWIGDGNNVSHSWIHAAARFGFSLRLACPVELQPAAAILDWAKKAGADIMLGDDPVAAASGADAILTDVWVSMGDTDEARRRKLLKPYQVDEKMMKKASPGAIFMHCLPAHRGDEVTAGVIDGPQSVVFDEAENRLHAQKAILAWCLGLL